MKIIVPRVKPRMHGMLFESGSPYKPKKQKSKKAYRRREKHRVDFLS